MSEQGSEGVWVSDWSNCLPTIMKTLNWTYLFNWKDVPAVIREFFFYSVHSFIHLFAHSFQASIMLFFCWFHPYPQHSHDEYTLPLLLLLPHYSCSLLLKVHSHKKLTLILTQNCENHTHYHLVCLFVMLLHVVIVVGMGWGGSDSMSDVSAPIMSAQNQHIYFRRVEENFCFGYC